MAQEANKKISVRVTLDDPVYIVDGQSLCKTYINSIVCKQWFDSEGHKVQQITYGVPADEVGHVITSKFVLDDFGQTIFTSLQQAQAKFDSLSEYAKDNLPHEETEEPEDEEGEITNSSGESYITNGTITGIGAGEDAVVDRSVISETNDPNGYCNFDCYNCSKYDICAKKDKKEKTINIGTGKSDITDYIKVEDEPDLPTVPDEIVQNIARKDAYTYYDSNGSMVSSSTGDSSDYTTYTTSTGEKAVGDIIRVKWYDIHDRIIYRVGDKINAGPFVYADGTVVPLGTIVYSYKELVGNANRGGDGIQYYSSDATKVSEDMDIEPGDE